MADATVESNGIKYSYQRKTNANNKDGVYYLYEITLPDTWSSDTQSLSLVPYNNGTNFPTVIGNSDSSNVNQIAVDIKYENSNKPLTGLKLTCDSNEHIISIGENAFANNRALLSIDLSGCIGLTTIGNSAFFLCSALRSINLSKCTKLTTIGTFAFRECSVLSSINLSSCIGLQTIGESAFTRCTALTSINLSSCIGLQTIGESAFCACAALKLVDLSGCNKLQTIGNAAFQSCGTLTSINLSGCVVLQTIGNAAFRECAALTSINLSGCVVLQTISQYAFNKCGALISIDLSYCTKLTTIGEYSFTLCNKLESINLSGCTELGTIGTFAFADCVALTSINLSECTKLTIIGGDSKNAFLNNPNLKNIIIENMDKDKLCSLIGILKDQVIDKTNAVKIVDKNMQICLSESNGSITDLIDYTKSSNDFLNDLLPNATFRYMCHYTGSAGLAETALKTIYYDISDSDKIIKPSTEDKVKLFYYGTDPENPTQLKFYSNHDDYYNYITLDNTKNTENLKTASDVKFVYITDYIQQLLPTNKLLINTLNNTLQLDDIKTQLKTATEAKATAEAEATKAKEEKASAEEKIKDLQNQLKQSKTSFCVIS
jgi:BspA type Leucine rich repeat region (6 copies)